LVLIISDYQRLSAVSIQMISHVGGVFFLDHNEHFLRLLR
jgi:hypothetical protein